MRSLLLITLLLATLAHAQRIVPSKTNSKLPAKLAGYKSTNKSWAGLKSLKSTNKIYITYHNATKKTVSVNWVNFQGAHQKYFDLPAGQSRLQETYPPHPWVFKAGTNILGYWMESNLRAGSRKTVNIVDYVAPKKVKVTIRVKGKKPAAKTKTPVKKPLRQQPVKKPVTKPKKPVSTPKKPIKYLLNGYVSRTTAIKGLKSYQSKDKIYVIFRNMTSKPVSVNWVQFDGKPKKYFDLTPKQARLQATYVPHAWVFKQGVKIIGYWMKPDLKAGARLAVNIVEPKATTTVKKPKIKVTVKAKPKTTLKQQPKKPVAKPKKPVTKPKVKVTVKPKKPVAKPKKPVSKPKKPVAKPKKPVSKPKKPVTKPKKPKVKITIRRKPKTPVKPKTPTKPKVKITVRPKPKTPLTQRPKPAAPKPKPAPKIKVTVKKPTTPATTPACKPDSDGWWGNPKCWASLKSKTGKKSITVTFYNVTKEDLVLNTVDSNGKLQTSRKLAPGAKNKVKTFSEQFWAVTRTDHKAVGYWGLESLEDGIEVMLKLYYDKENVRAKAMVRRLGLYDMFMD